MRFSLRCLLLVVAAIAFLGAVCFAFPVWLANIVMAPLPLIVPGVLTVALIYGPKSTRPFYIGALAPFVVVLLSSSGYARGHYHYVVITRELYSQIGQAREFIVGEDLAYIQVTFLLLCSLVAGFLGLGVAWLVRDERGEG